MLVPMSRRHSLTFPDLPIEGIKKLPQFPRDAGLGFGIGAAFFGQFFERSFHLGFVTVIFLQGTLASPISLGNGRIPRASKFRNLAANSARTFVPSWI